MEYKRSISAVSTVSMIQRRVMQYQKLMVLNCVFLSIASTIFIFSACILLKFYFLGHLHFWSVVFKITPLLIMALGVFKLAISVYGFTIFGHENKVYFYVFAALLSVAFIIQVASIFMALEVRTEISLGLVGGHTVDEQLWLYGNDSVITSQMDTLQRNLRCCGGTGWEDGYVDYQSTPFGTLTRGVPDSCCRREVKGCGRNMLYYSDRKLKGIFVEGCFTILQTLLETEVVPMVACYAVVGGIVALTDLLAIYLSMAAVIQFDRQIEREAKLVPPVHDGSEVHEGDLSKIARLKQTDRESKHDETKNTN